MLKMTFWNLISKTNYRFPVSFNQNWWKEDVFQKPYFGTGVKNCSHDYHPLIECSCTCFKRLIIWDNQNITLNNFILKYLLYVICLTYFRFSAHKFPMSRPNETLKMVLLYFTLMFWRFHCLWDIGKIQLKMTI